MEPIIVQGYTSRIAALFYHALWKRKLLPPRRDKIGRRDEVDAAIRNLQAAVFLEVIDEVRSAAFTRTA
jgi:hypothetical protein